jgi:hypothetical protein
MGECVQPAVLTSLISVTFCVSLLSSVTEVPQTIAAGSSSVHGLGQWCSAAQSSPTRADWSVEVGRCPAFTDFSVSSLDGTMEAPRIIAMGLISLPVW